MKIGKNKTVIGQALSVITIIFFIVCLLIVLIFPKLVNKDINHFVYENVLNTAEIVKSAMDTSMKSSNTIERLIDEKLHVASIEIAEELRGKEIEDITQEDLVQIREKLNIYDISLLIRQNDDIIIAQSSDPHEVGLSTRDWGYWYTAFDELMSGKEVTVGKGYYKADFWSGPISRSEWENKYYKYAYYFDGSTDYLINPYILDTDIKEVMEDSDPQSLIDRMNDTGDLEEIAVINVGALFNGDAQEIIEPEEDMPVLYGKNTYRQNEDFHYYDKVLNENDIFHLDFKENQLNYRKFYIPVSKDKVMVIVSNVNAQEALVKKLTIIFILTFVTAFIVIFIVLQIAAKKYLKPLEIINTHINQIAAGDLTNKIHINQDNELGNISIHLNKMTDDFSLLIGQVRKRIDSVMLISSMLSETVHCFFKKMDDISSTMTVESRGLFHEIDLQVESIQKSYQEIAQKIEQNDQLNNHDLSMLLSFIKGSSSKILDLNEVMKTNVNNITDLNLSTYDAIEHLNQVISQLDNVSKDLESKIKIFKVADDEEKH